MKKKKSILLPKPKTKCFFIWDAWLDKKALTNYMIYFRRQIVFIC